MKTLAQYRDVYQGRRFVIIGKGPTPFEFEQLSKTTDPVIFINDSVQLAKHAPKAAERFFFAHDASQAVWLTPDLSATAVLPLAPDDEERRAEHPHQDRLFAANFNLRHGPEIVTYNWGGRYDDVASVSRGDVARSGRLAIGGGGTIYTAVHFAWFCGATDIAFVGCDGQQPHRYNARLDIRSDAPNLGLAGEIRKRTDRLCAELGLRTEYVRKRLLPLIPRIAHWVWFGGEVPGWAREHIDRFRELHPDWRVRLHRDWPDDAPEVLNQAWGTCTQKCQWADLMYLYLLDRVGGVVIDTDTWFLRNMTTLLYDHGAAWTTKHNDRHSRLTNGMMGAVPGSAAFRRAIAAVKSMGTGKRCRYGPDLLTRLFTVCGDSDMRILPWWYFYPFRVPERDQAMALRGADAARTESLLAPIADRFVDGCPPYSAHLWGMAVPGEGKSSHVGV